MALPPVPAATVAVGDELLRLVAELARLESRARPMGVAVVVVERNAKTPPA